MTDPPAGTALVEVSVPVDGEAAEAVCELFERYGGGAVVEVRVRRNADDGADLAVPETTVRTYLVADDVEGRARVELGLWHLAQIHPFPEASIRTLAEANWAEAWKAHFTPQRIGRRLLVVPSWLEAAPGPDDLVLRLDPGRAFGTGLHPSTRLCLAALEDVVAGGDAVLDVGTGSGILAIGALCLGAGRAVALDLDPGAVAVALENAALNGVALDPFAGPLADLPPGRFDVVVANLLAGTIVGLAAQLAARVAERGVLVASGILETQGPEVAAALVAAGFAPPATRRSGDWVSLEAARAGATPAAGA